MFHVEPVPRKTEKAEQRAAKRAEQRAEVEEIFHISKKGSQPQDSTTEAPASASSWLHSMFIFAALVSTGVFAYKSIQRFAHSRNAAHAAHAAHTDCPPQQPQIQENQTIVVIHVYIYTHIYLVFQFLVLSGFSSTEGCPVPRRGCSKLGGR